MSSPTVIATGLEQAIALVDSISPADLDRPTPCTEWTVRDLTGHLANSTAQMAVMARGGQPDWSALGARHDDPAQALRQAAADLRAAVDGGESAAPVGMLVAEIAVHTWDLATALGAGTADLAQEVAEAGHAFMSESLTEDRRGDAFAPEQPAPDHGSAYDRLAAFAGRTVRMAG